MPPPSLRLRFVVAAAPYAGLLFYATSHCLFSGVSRYLQRLRRFRYAPCRRAKPPAIAPALMHEPHIFIYLFTAIVHTFIAVSAADLRHAISALASRFGATRHVYDLLSDAV